MNLEKEHKDRKEYDAMEHQSGLTYLENIENNPTGAKIWTALLRLHLVQLYERNERIQKFLEDNGFKPI